jgi:hypothetical protein
MIEFVRLSYDGGDLALFGSQELLKLPRPQGCIDGKVRLVLCGPLDLLGDGVQSPNAFPR